MVAGLVSDYRISLRRACHVSLLSTSVWYYKNVRKNDAPLRQRIRNIAETRVRYGIERIVVLLKREGWKDNHKRVYRIYKEEGLNLRVKRPRCCRLLHTAPSSLFFPIYMIVGVWILLQMRCSMAERSVA